MGEIFTQASEEEKRALRANPAKAAPNPFGL